MPSHSPPSGARIAWGTAAFLVFPLGLLRFPAAVAPQGLPFAQPVTVYLILLLALGLGLNRGAGIRITGWILPLFILAILVCQGVAMYHTAAYWSAPWSELFTAYASLLLQGLTLLAAVLGLRVLAQLPGGLTGLWRGWLCAALLLLGIWLISLIWLGAGPSPRNLITGLVGGETLAGMLESVRDGLHGFLRGVAALGLAGGGVQLSQAAGPAGVTDREVALAVLMLVAPVLLGWRTVSPVWARRLLTVAVVLLFPVLLIGRGPACMVGAMWLVLWLFAGLVLRLLSGWRAWLVVALAVGFVGAVVGCLAYVDPGSRGILLRALDGEWSTLRAAVQAELLQIFLDHPLVGTGADWSTVYVVSSDSILARVGPEAVRAWLAGAALPDPRSGLRLLAEFGAPLAGLAVASLVWLAIWLGLQDRQDRSGGHVASRARLAFVACGAWICGLVLLLLGSGASCSLVFVLPLPLFWASAGRPPQPRTPKSALATDPRSRQSPAAFESPGFGQAQAAGPDDARTDALISRSAERPFTMTG